VKKLIDAREAVKERKTYLSKKMDAKRVKGWVEEEEEEAIGSAVKEPEGGLGNFTGSGDLAIPAEQGKYRLTSGFGIRVNPTGGGGNQNHWGLDLAPASVGSRDCKILSAGDGVVVAAGPASGFGNWIVIKHKDDLYTIYGHMAKRTIKVKVGDQVKQGQHIAMMGNEGISTGVHLHFETTRDFSNRKGKGKDGKYNTFDPKTVISFGDGSGGGTTSSNAFSTRSFTASDSHDGHDHGHSMHGDYGLENQGLDEEGKKVDAAFKEHYAYKPVIFKGGFIRPSGMTRESFLTERIGWGRSTDYSGLESLDKSRFIHSEHYDGHEGNLYSPDAKSIFESLLLKVKKPYFEVVSGFRYSEEGLLSPHEAGCAIDIWVKDLEEVREIADCAWVMGIRSIAIGGNFEKQQGFIHLDICPKGKDFGYDGVSIYGGPGKWVMK